MTNIHYIGASIANFKSVKIVPGVNALDTDAVIQIGLGPYLLTQEGGWNATVLSNLWNNSANPFFKQITATVQGTALILTANTLGLDFEPVCTINGTAVQVSSLQRLTIVAGAGTFTVSDTNVASGNITYSATPATLVSHIQTAINAMTGYSAGDVAVSYDVVTGYYWLDFSGGQFAGVNISQWTADGSSLTGGTAAAVITRTQTGNAGTDEIVSVSFPADGTHTEDLNTIQKITVAGNSGSFQLAVPGFGTTAPIPYNAGRSVAKRILEDLIGQGSTIITGGPLSETQGDGGHSQEIDDVGSNAGAYSPYRQVNGGSGWYDAAVDGNPNFVVGFTERILFRVPVHLDGDVSLASAYLKMDVFGPIDTALKIEVYNGGHDAPWPTNYTDAGTILGTVTGNAIIPSGVNGQFLVDVTSLVNTAIAQSGWVSGDHILFVISDPTGSGGAGGIAFGPIGWNGHSYDYSQLNSTFIAGGGGSGSYQNNVGGTYDSVAVTWASSNFGAGFAGPNGKYAFFHSDNLAIPNAALMAGFNTSVSNSFSGTGTPPYKARIYGVKTHNSYPTNAASAAADVADLTTAYVEFSIPDSNQINLDLTAIAQEIVNHAGWTSGDQMTFVMYAVSPTPGTISIFPECLGLTHWSYIGGPTILHRDLFVEFVGTLAGRDIAAMTPSGAANASVTVTQTGGSQTVENITGGFWSLVIPGHFTVANIPYNVTDTLLESMINSANGGVACCTVTGGPAPGTPLSIHFNGALAKTAMAPYITLSLTGSFGDTIHMVEIRAAQSTPSARNVYELVVCPGEGTLALTNASADGTRFFAVMTILEPNPINPVYDPTTSRQIYIPLLNINADRIEGAINESFGKDVVRVCRTGHSLEHRKLAMHENVSAVNTEAGFLHFWYYIDKFRLVFVNDYANSGSISQITISFASISDVNPAPAGPSIWMDTVGVPVDQANSNGDFKDMYPEYVRTYLGFTGMADAGTPIHQLTIAPYTSYTDNKFAYKAKLMNQYPFGGGLTTPAIPDRQDPLRAGLARQLIDHTVVFNWHAYKYVRDQEIPGDDTPLGTSVQVPWDAQPEVFQSALEAIFGAGNVVVTGSLVNSWLSEDDIDVANEEMAYNELRITLINECAYLPFNEIGYGLSMTLSNPFAQDNDTIRSAVPYLEPYSKPLPLQINNRQRIVVGDGETNAFTFGVGTQLITLTRETTVQAAQDQLNALLGTNDTLQAPAKYKRSVTLYGSDFTQPVEVEFTGAGYQFTQQTLIFGFVGSTSVGLLTVTQLGVNPTQEVQALNITGNPYSGNYTVHGSGNITYNANAATIQTAVGAAPPTVAGTYPHFTLTWPSASGPQTLWTTTSALNNAAVSILQTQEGGIVNGLSANISVSDLAQGQGPLYWDNIANYSPAQVPGSDDVLIFDDATSAVQYGLDQSSIFSVAKLGINPSLRHSRLRQVFQNNQKVWLKTQGTAPGGLTLGNSYYVINQAADYTFQLAATPGGDPIEITSVGVGPLMLCVHNPEIQIYARYAGNQIGLPNINSGVGLPEYLPRYLKVSGPTMTIGIGDGNALSMLRVDTMTEAANIQVLTSGQSLVNNIPAFLFLFNNAASAINIVDGDCGIAVYSDETSTLGPITGTGGSLLLHAVNAGSVLANGLVVTEQNVLVGGMSTL